MLERIRTVLDGGMGKQREQDCRAYLMRLTDENLLLYYRQEAGLIHYKDSTPPPIHWGWDGPFSPIRGTFTGHWLSAASRFVFLYDDRLLRARIDASWRKSLLARGKGQRLGLSDPGKAPLLAGARKTDLGSAICVSQNDDGTVRRGPLCGQRPKRSTCCAARRSGLSALPTALPAIRCRI